jgi:tRNA(Arg) A34 adenosine deaminase TadA
MKPRIAIRIPPWLEEFRATLTEPFPDDEARMSLAIELARRNVEAGTGGPFGAAVFDRSTGRLVAPGVNLVVSAGCSVLHAEVVALVLAEERLRSYDLHADGQPSCVLATSVEPCVMCLGAVHWAGIDRLLCGARGEDAEAIGFDEGPKPANWPTELTRRGMEVVRDVRRREATAVLESYRSRGGIIYNSSRER